jgi:hypothetical protein
MVVWGLMYVYVVLASGTGGIWNYINSSQCLYSKKTRAGGWQGIPKAGHSNLFLFFFANWTRVICKLAALILSYPHLSLDCGVEGESILTSRVKASV